MVDSLFPSLAFHMFSPFLFFILALLLDICLPFCVVIPGRSFRPSDSLLPPPLFVAHLAVLSSALFFTRSRSPSQFRQLTSSSSPCPRIFASRQNTPGASSLCNNVSACFPLSTFYCTYSLLGAKQAQHCRSPHVARCLGTELILALPCFSFLQRSF